MKLSMKEKKILYAFACPSHHNTATRLKWLTALTVDPEAKRRMLGLARKVETEVDESWYEAFYHHLRMEMDEYRRLKRSLRVLKSYTDYEAVSYTHLDVYKRQDKELPCFGRCFGQSP